MPHDPLSNTFAALADPTRRAILSRLAGGEASVTELAAPFRMSLPAVSKHLKVLERAGLITRGRDAQWRPRRLDPAPLKDASDWIEGYRRFWEERLARLDEYVQELQAKEQAEQRGTDGGDAVSNSAPVVRRSSKASHADQSNRRNRR